VVQEKVPDAHIVYVDNDPVVVAHAGAMMASKPEGRVTVLRGDLTRPEGILTAPALRETLDLAQPVALSLIAVMHLVASDDTVGIVNALTSALAPGSHLVMTHATTDFHPDVVARVHDVLRKNGIDLRTCSRDDFARFFTGLELVEPGVEVPQCWRPGITPPASAATRVPLYAAVARKPPTDHQTAQPDARRPQGAGE
jgi:hypothetical protein